MSNKSPRELVCDQLEQARKRLLDLTFRNRLLNFKPTRTGTIRIVDEIVREIYDILVIQGKTMDFDPIEVDEAELADPPEDSEVLEEPREEDIAAVWALAPGSAELHSRHTDRTLQTNLPADVLQKRLFYIDKNARSVIEELGVSFLYLAMAFVRWKERPEDAEYRKAPLILVPIALKRANARTRFEVEWSGEDIVTNVSLQHKLVEYGVTLPDFEMPEEKDGIDEYLRRVSESLGNAVNSEVVSEIYVSSFNSRKFMMYRDLDPTNWKDDHLSLIEATVAGGDSLPADPGVPSPSKPVTPDPETMYHVCDADPSQIAVIESVKAGQNLVVEGPPGTGKSQTITNVIAELLAAGKHVLFVSEKMAALQVVKERLDKVGLGGFCLELHSHKATRKQVVEELKRCANRDQGRSTGGKQLFQDHREMVRQLGDYADALRKPVGALNLTPYALFGWIQHARRHFGGDTGPVVELNDVENWTGEQWSEARSALRDLSAILHKVGTPKSNPWSASKRQAILPNDVRELGQHVKTAMAAVEALVEDMSDAASLVGAVVPTKASDVDPLLDALAVMTRPSRCEKDAIADRVWDGSKPEELITLITDYRNSARRISKCFSQSVTDLRQLELDEYTKLLKKRFRIFNGRYRALKNQIHALYSGKPTRGMAQRISDIDELKRFLNLRSEVKERSPEGERLFGVHWSGLKTDPEGLRRHGTWVKRFRSLLNAGVLTDRSAEVAASGKPIETREWIEGVRSGLDSVNTDIAKISATLELDDAVLALDQLPYAEVLGVLTAWRDAIDTLQSWSRYQVLHGNTMRTVAEPFLSYVDDGSIDPLDLEESLKANYAHALLGVAFRARPALTSFDGVVHEQKIRSFQELDKAMIELNQDRLQALLAMDQPAIYGCGTDPEFTFLKREFSRKRKFSSIRKLMSTAGKTIRSLKPCFMMSPLSVAQFLETDVEKFDVVIFDEASQVKPEDAFGALCRGNQAMIVGDTRQLPPTSFFEKMVEESEEEIEDLTGLADTESILHQYRRSFPNPKMLKWHYRSRHESLIAVSNREFYDNELLVYPSSVDKDEYLGLHLRYCAGTEYDRGRSQTNRMEARLVARAAVEHYQKLPHKSLGVGTFNRKQQDLILEEVELLRRENPEYDEYFREDADERFFVKNLETIQGDERDVIFVSVGYGFDAQGRLSKNFGPLNKAGGERRLNVLFTRARERCVIFSNFTAADLDVTEFDSVAVRVLKTFLDYAETRNLTEITTSLGESESPFEESVYHFLRDEGWTVRKQVGCASYRIDLAIVHPEKPGRYLIGIECDGATYHSSASARERDRLRQQVLENLGWTICRVWSTDWYCQQKSAKRRLLEAVERAAATVPKASDTGSSEPFPAIQASKPEAEPAPQPQQERNLEPDLEPEPELQPQPETNPVFRTETEKLTRVIRSVDLGPDLEKTLVPFREHDFANIRGWVRSNGIPVTVFDLEATQRSPHFNGFGITEVGLVHISDRGVFAGSALVNPEHRISAYVTELTGIAQHDVARQPNWNHLWRDVFHEISRHYVTAGYNSWAYDCPAVELQNERYGQPDTHFESSMHIDVYRLAPLGGGKLGDCARRYGVDGGAQGHCALSDAVVTARLLDKVILRMTNEQLFAKPSRQKPAFDAPSREVRRREILAILNGGQAINIKELATRFGRAPGTIEADLVELVSSGQVRPEAVGDKETQDLLERIGPSAIDRAWPGSRESRLSALRSEVKRMTGSAVDYFQLRIYLMRHGYEYDSDAGGWVQRLSPTSRH